jgi:hypothetical protein
LPTSVVSVKRTMRQTRGVTRRGDGGSGAHARLAIEVSGDPGALREESHHSKYWRWAHPPNELEIRARTLIGIGPGLRGLPRTRLLGRSPHPLLCDRRTLSTSFQVHHLYTTAVDTGEFLWVQSGPNRLIYAGLWTAVNPPCTLGLGLWLQRRSRVRAPSVTLLISA